jgi:hypothetical protein
LDPTGAVRQVGKLKSRLNEKKSQRLAGLLLLKLRAKIGPANEIGSNGHVHNSSQTEHGRDI